MDELEAAGKLKIVRSWEFTRGMDQAYDPAFAQRWEAMKVQRDAQGAATETEIPQFMFLAKRLD